MNSNIGGVIIPDLGGGTKIGGGGYTSGWGNSYSFDNDPTKYKMYTFKDAEVEKVDFSDLKDDSEKWWGTFAKNCGVAVLTFGLSYVSGSTEWGQGLSKFGNLALNGGGGLLIAMGGSTADALWINNKNDTTIAAEGIPNQVAQNAALTAATAGVMSKTGADLTTTAGKSVIGTGVKNKFFDVTQILGQKTTFETTQNNLTEAMNACDDGANYAKWLEEHPGNPDPERVISEVGLENVADQFGADTNVVVKQFLSTLGGSSLKYGLLVFGLEMILGIGVNAGKAGLSKGKVTFTDLKMGETALKSMTKAIANVASLFLGKTAGAAVKAAGSLVANYVCVPFQEMFKGDDVMIQTSCGVCAATMAIGATAGLAVGITIAAGNIAALGAAATFSGVCACLGPIGWCILAGAAIAFIVTCLVFLVISIFRAPDCEERTIEQADFAAA